MLSFVISVLTAIVAWIASYILKDAFFKTINKNFIILIVFSIPVYFFNNQLISLIQAFYKIKARNLFLLSQSAINLLLVIVLMAIIGMGLKGAVLASITPLLIIAIMSALLLFRELNLKEVSLDITLIKKLLIFGFKTHTGNILKDLTYRGDMLIISYFLAPEQVGYYAIAVSIAEVIWRIPDAIGSVLLPYISMINKKDAQLFTPQLCRRLLLPMIVVCIFVAIAGKSLVTFIFGREYQPSIQALILLIPGVVALTLWKILATDTIAQGHPVQYSLTSGIALLAMIIMDLWLIPVFGINGASVASSISYIIATAFIVFIYIKLTKNKIWSVLIPLKADFIFYKSAMLLITKDFKSYLSFIGKGRMP
jgi:O-antigen/teichoic acid export membrane protein